MLTLSRARNHLATDVPFIACVINSPCSFSCCLDLSNFFLFYGLDCRILEFWPSVSCWSVLWVLQDVTALITCTIAFDHQEANNIPTKHR